MGNELIQDEVIQLDLLTKSGELLPAVAELTSRCWNEGDFSKTETQIVLRWCGNVIVGRDWNYFDAFCGIREQLESFELMPSCYGACRNLVVSGMQADMSLGIAGYLVRKGIASKLDNCVRIFDSGVGMDLVSVSEQKKFKEEWLESLRQRAD